MNNILTTRARLALVSRMVVAVTILAVVSVLVFAVAVAAVGTLVTMFLLYASYYLTEELGWSYAEMISGVVTTQTGTSVLVAGLALSPLTCLWPTLREIRAFRTRLTRGSPAAESHPYVHRRVQRLAQQADVPTPDVVVRETATQESYALGGRADGTIVLSESIIWTLNVEEMEAVLAHELAHLLNGDSRIMGVAVLPLLIAEDLTSNSGVGSYFSVAPGLPAIVFTIAQPLALCCQFGTSLLSRNREFAADEGAVALTGDPATLASALAKLDGTDDTPAEDLRSSSAGALNILPPERSLVSQGPFRSHPTTTTRIERLQRRASDLES